MILFWDRDGQPMSSDEWDARMYDLAYKHVAVTAINDRVHVSTVWMGIDHNFGDEGPPLIFETMVFGGGSDNLTRRYPTLEAAEAGHEQVVEQAREMADKLER